MSVFTPDIGKYGPQKNSAFGLFLRGDSLKVDLLDDSPICGFGFNSNLPCSIALFQRHYQ